MVEVEPVVFGQLTAQHLFIVNDGVGDFRIGQYQRNGIIPWLFGLGRIDGNFRCCLQLHHIHVRLGVHDAAHHIVVGRIRYHFIPHTPNEAFLFEGLVVLEAEAATSVVQQPVGLTALFQHPVGDAIGFEVVCLAFVHGNQQIGCPQRQDSTNNQEQK